MKVVRQLLNNNNCSLGTTCHSTNTYINYSPPSLQKYISLSVSREIYLKNIHGQASQLQKMACTREALLLLSALLSTSSSSSAATAHSQFGLEGEKLLDFLVKPVLVSRTGRLQLTHQVSLREEGKEVKENTQAVQRQELPIKFLSNYAYGNLHYFCL